MTPAAKSGWKLPGLTGVLETAGKFNKLPVGGSFGLVAGALLIWATPLELLSGMGALTILLGMVGGLAFQRMLKWTLGWYADTALERAESRREADLKLERLRHYQSQGVLGETDARRFALRIAREDLFGAPKARGPRGPYRRRGSPTAPEAAKKAPT